MAAGEMIAFGWIGSALYTGLMGQNKNRSGCGWFLIGLALGPIGLLISFFVPKLDPAEQADPSVEGAEDSPEAEP